MKFIYILILILSITTFSINAQQKEVSKLTKEEILKMSVTDLADYDLESLMQMMNIVGASSIDEMYKMILNQNVTIASKSNEKLFNSALSTSVINQKEIKSSGATSIEEALRLIPGVIVREKTQGNYDVQIRGNQNILMYGDLANAENSTTLVMVNGRPVFDNAMGTTVWETLPVSINEIDRIEVVRGSSSALYGPNAVSGVINIITENSTDSEDEPALSVNYQGGVPGTHIADLTLKKKFKNDLSLKLTPYYVSRQRRSEKVYLFDEDTYSDIDTYSQLYSDVDVKGVYSDPKKTKEKKGVNLYIDKALKDVGNISLSGGYLNSDALTSSLKVVSGTSYACRESEAYYANLDAKLYNFNLLASINSNVQNYDKTYATYKVDRDQYNLLLNYTYNLKSLKIRPEISWQKSSFANRKYTSSESGIISGGADLSNYAGDLHLEYGAFNDKLKIIAAIRDEKFNSPDLWKLSWQFAGTYNINDKNMIRVVASKSNQSSTMKAGMLSYSYSYSDETLGDILYNFNRKDDSELMSMNTFELGYRCRPAKNILLDFEAFYNKGQDYGFILPDSTAMSTSTGVTSIYTSYHNFDLVSKQIGATINCKVVLSEKFYFNVNATWQQLKLDNYCDQNLSTILTDQMTEYYTDYYTDLYTGTTKDEYSSSLQPDSYQDKVKNEATPSFWGSILLNYKPIEKLSISAQGYYYGKSYTYTEYDDQDSKYATGNMDSKYIINAKVNYNINKKVSVFFNGRNVLDNDKREFVYMDKIGGVYLLGLNVNL